MSDTVHHNETRPLTVTSRRRRSDLGVKIGFIVVLVTSIVAVVYPVYWMVVASFAPEGYVSSHAPLLLPSKFSLESYIHLFQSKPMLLWLWNTLVVTIGATLITVPIATLAAYALNRYRFWGRRYFVFFVLLVQLLPATSMIVPFFIIFRQLHLLNSLFGIVVAFQSFTLPLAIWVLWGYLQSIPFDFEEAALVDGCSPIGAFFRVTVPLALPGLAATALFIFLESWNNYLFPLVLTSTRHEWVISLGLFSFIGAYMVQVEQMLAASVITVIPAFALFFVLQRYLRGGLALGGMKG